MEDSAYVLLSSTDLSADIAALEAADFQLMMICPADEPRVAQLVGHGISLRLDTQASSAPATIHVPSLDEPITTSAGVTITAADSSWVTPDLDSTYVFTSGGDWGDGRAGMQYRDLLPQRHGGRVIASHIRIPEPGPVPDYVHHHDIAFQMIFCRRGRVQVVYEDQGEPFWIEPGDVVLQPPHIRHRVLASDGGCEVVEIAAPAEHPTFIDTELTLPTGTVDAARDFGGQAFCFNRAAELRRNQLDNNWSESVTGLGAATNGLGTVRVLEAGDGPITGESRGDLCLLYVLEGHATLATGDELQQIAVDDSIAVEAGSKWTLDEASDDFRCLHISLGDTAEAMRT